MNEVQIKSPWPRRIRAFLIHVLGPIVLFAAFLIVTTSVNWHGGWTDSAMILLIMAVNVWSIWTAEWNRNLTVKWRTIITISAILLVFVTLNYIAYNYRVNMMPAGQYEGETEIAVIPQR